VQLGERVPWLRVVVDRTGADLLAAPTGSVPRAMRVPGPERYPLRKAAPGGWSQPRYQRAAEETWDRNAARVSEVVGDLAGQVRARVLLLAGDVRERALVAQHLAEELPPGIRVVQTDAGSRAEGAAEQPLAEATDSAVRDEAARQRGEVLDAYRRERGRASRGMARTAASAGLPDVVEALREGKVDTLLVDPNGLASSMDCRLWVGIEPEQIGIDMAELRAMGATEPWPERAEDALLRTATSIEADLLAVSGDEAPLVDGVGAYLRYP
jgi:peptide subunit release factor 1 (eRF1)